MAILFFKDEHRWLSNFWPAEVRIRLVQQHTAVECATVEHGYQALKTLDDELRLEIAQARTAGTAKRMGKHVLLRPDWSNVREGLMLDLLRQKFRHPHLAQRLLATGTELLVEGNHWHDNFWGNCTCPRCGTSPGQNKLGQLLAQVRGELASGQLQPRK